MQVLGIIDLYWIGQKVDIDPGGTFTLGGVRNKPVPYGRQIGRAQEMKASEIDVTAIITAGMSITAITGTQEGELQIKCDTGQTYVWESAFLIDAPSASAGEGKLKLKWNGGEPQELLS